MNNKKEDKRTRKILVIVFYSILIFAGKFVKQDLDSGRDLTENVHITVSDGYVHMDVIM